MRRSGVAAAALAQAATLVTLALAVPARADLADDVETLTLRFRAEGGKRTVLLPPRLMSSRETAGIALPLWATSGAGAPASCTTVAVLGALSTVFALRLPGPDARPERADGRTSVAGTQVLVRCGAERTQLSDLSLEMRSPHAVIETVVAESPAPLRDVRSILPHRDAGLIPPPSRPPGAPPHPGPLVARAAAFEDELVEARATDLSRRVVAADDAGAGRVVLDLAPGCHRLAVFAHDADGEAPRTPDVDAELAWVSGDIGASDRTDSPDASLDACTATRALAIVAFAGAPEHGSVLLIRGRTELPRGVPAEWGGAAIARIAKALLDRHAPAPEAPPIYSSLGVAGRTVLPIEVEPGQCYLAALTLVDGTASLVSLAAEAGGPRSSAHTDEPTGAAVVTFCAGPGGGGRGVLESELHGPSLVSALGLWPMGHRKLGEDAP